MKIKLLTLFAGVTALTLMGCEKESGPEATQQAARVRTVVSATVAVPNVAPCVTKNLMAGQHNNIGSVNVYFDINNVYIEYLTTADWFINKTHLYAGTCELIPVNRNGIPVPGQFPISNTFANGSQSAVYVISRASLPDCFCIAAHAEVRRVNDAGQTVQVETAWGAGERFTPKSWAMYFSACQSECFDDEDYYFPNK